MHTGPGTTVPRRMKMHVHRMVSAFPWGAGLAASLCGDLGGAAGVCSLVLPLCLVCSLQHLRSQTRTFLQNAGTATFQALAAYTRSSGGFFDNAWEQPKEAR